MGMKIYNSLSRQIEDFSPLDTDGKIVKIYTCGPTVYDYVTIGNWRTYVLSDLVLRALRAGGYSLDFVMNITDVGHLTGDNEGDSSLGEDRLEKGAKREGKTAWDVARFYANDFLDGFKTLGLIKPKKFTKATDYIQQQINLVQRIESAGFAYEISEDGIYFDTRKYEEVGNDYGVLSTLDQVKEGARVEINQNKRDPRDFALWKHSPKDEKRHMEWKSPWGVGFPGWHIECSAMIMTELSEQIDIHLGGEDLKSTHHPNEIAQSESVTGKKPFVKYWIHGAFLQVDGGRMGKSLGNAFTLHDIVSRGYEPLALKYFYMTGHYRKALNFTWEALNQSQVALEKLWEKAVVFGAYSQLKADDREPSQVAQRGYQKIEESVFIDFNFPQALGILHDTLSKTKDDFDTLYVLDNAEKLFGLQFRERGEAKHKEALTVNEKYKNDLIRRANHQKLREFEKADQIRNTILSELGQDYEIVDTQHGSYIRKK